MTTEGKDVGTFVHHGAKVVGVARTVDCSKTRDAVVEHPPGVLRVSGKEAQLAKRLDDWRRAGLLSDEQYRERILSSGRIMSLRELNEAHRITFKTRDHDLTAKPIRTLADVNARNRAAWRCA